MIEEFYFFDQKVKDEKLFHNVHAFIRDKKVVLTHYKHVKETILSKSDCIEIIETLKKVLDKIE